MFSRPFSADSIFSDSAINSAPQLPPEAPLQQSVLYAQGCSALGAQARVVQLDGGNALLLHRRLPLLGQVALLSRGPVQVSHQDARALREHVGTPHLLVTAETPYIGTALDRAGFWPLARGRHVAELQVGPDREVMMRRLGGKWRNRLRHAQKQDLRVTGKPMPADVDHWLLKAEAQAARWLKYRPYDPAIVVALLAAQPSCGHVFIARKAGRAVAAMLFLRHGQVATYQIGWSDAAGRAASAGNLLLWQAMTVFGASGVTRLDLGAADQDAAPGLCHFKRGTGAQVRRLGGTWLRSICLPGRSWPIGSGALPRKPA